jgi:mono/diheme cytochrome c family protein
MKSRVNQLKKVAIALVILPLFATLLLSSTSVKTRAADGDKDVATVYKESKCVICHGAQAAKFFDPAIPEDQLVEAILKGKKAEKPPNMPAFEEKGINADQAKALVTYMKSLKQ